VLKIFIYLFLTLLIKQVGWIEYGTTHPVLVP